MAARAHSSDPRAERVRARLARGGVRARTRSARSTVLTVGDIVARAGVSRQVFYQHFRDRDDAVATAFAVAFAAAAADHSGDARARILRLFDFAAEHRSMYRNVVPSAVTQRVVTAFRAELLPACEEIAAQGMPAVAADRQPDPGVGDAIPRRRVHGGAAVVDGRPRLDRPRRPRRRGPRHRQRSARPDRTYERSSPWVGITPPSHTPRAIAPPSAPWPGDDRLGGSSSSR